ncbi:MAG TPA: SRPBCC family protein [Chloroflexota bacterium]|nr:SRPBCC family protein [Chloroflexota bacterium]
MPVVERSIEINAPIDRVFAALTDPRRAAEWNPNVIEVRDFSGPLEVGATWRQTVAVAGRLQHLKVRVSRYSPPREGELEVTGDQRARIWTRCEDLGGRTRVTQGMDFAPPGGVLGVVGGPVARLMAEREIERSMRLQRELLEGETS